jgi:hypothetical protein
MSQAAVTAAGGSHHSVPIDDEVSEASLSNEAGHTERPLSKFNKGLFALISGYVLFPLKSPL